MVSPPASPLGASPSTISPTIGTTAIALPFFSGGLAATQFSSGIALYSHGLLSSRTPLISAMRRLNAMRLPSLSTRPASSEAFDKIGRAHVSTPVTNAHLVCRLLLEKKKNHR